MQYLPDFDEIGEMRAERYIEGNKIRCVQCGELKEFEEVEPTSADPYAAPICRVCLG